MRLQKEKQMAKNMTIQVGNVVVAQVKHQQRKIFKESIKNGKRMTLERLNSLDSDQRNDYVEAIREDDMKVTEYVHETQDNVKKIYANNKFVKTKISNIKDTFDVAVAQIGTKDYKTINNH